MGSSEWDTADIPSGPPVELGDPPRRGLTAQTLTARRTLIHVSWIVAMVPSMKASLAARLEAPSERCHVPSHVPSGATLLALQLSEGARGTRGLDVLRRSVDRAPPPQF